MNRIFAPGILVLAGLAGVASADDTARASIGDNRLSAGDEVTIDEYVPGNVYFAAGRVSLDDRIGGSAFVTGGEVDVTGSIGHNLYAAGGDLRIEGEVEGDVHAAGGKLRVPRGAKLRGDAALAGGNIDVEGDVEGDLEAYGESIYINSVVGGDVRLAGEDIRIGPDTRVSGRLEYKSGGTYVIDPKAQVEQGVQQLDADDHGWRRKAGRGSSRGGRTMFSLGVLVLGTLLILGLPAFTREAASAVRRDWWQSAGIGCVMLIGVPLAAVMLMVTIIGIPLALMLVFGYVVLLMLGYVIAAIFVGDFALERLGGERVKSVGWRVLFLLLALVLLSIVRHVPL
ncbi:MAG: polymer-forming cytoskeletal protein, partial [Steroidobacteraceae bacterium]